MNKNKIYNIIRVSELDSAKELQNLVFFGSDLSKNPKEQSVQVPYTLFKNVLEGKQNKLVAGTLIELVDNADSTTTINAESDPKKQNKLINKDGTITISELADGTTEIKAVTGAEGVQNDNLSGTKVLEVSEKVVTVTSNTETNYVGFKSNLNVIKLVNLSKLHLLFSLDDNTQGVNKILKDGELNQYALPPLGSIEFLKTSEGWLTIGLYGLSYFRDLIDTSEYDRNIIVKNDGMAKTEAIGVTHVVDLSIDSLSLEQLNDKYAHVEVNSTVTCNGIKYIKVDRVNGIWSSINLTEVK